MERRGKRDHNGKGKDEPHGIRLPGSLLDELKKGHGGEELEDDERYVLGEGMNKKRKTVLNRREKRKQEREDKKKSKTVARKQGKKQTKKQPTASPKKSKPVKHTQTQDESDEEEFAGFDDDLQTEASDVDDIGPSDVDSDDYDDFDNYNSEDFDEDEDPEEDDDDDDQPQTAEDTMAALMALKAKKKSSKPAEPKSKSKTTSVDETMALLKAKKDAKIREKEKTKEKELLKKNKKQEREKKAERFIDHADRQLMKRDDDDIKYYAKKLGLKSTKLSEMRSKSEDDGLGGLLDGLDFLDNYGDDSDGELDNYGSEGEEVECEFEVEEEEGEDEESEEGDEEEEDVHNGEDGEEETVENPFSSDDEINSSDFDSDLEDEDLNEDGDEDQGDVIMAAPRENPYVAATSGTTKYVPPALRKQLESQADTEQILKIKKLIKGPLNKLSEANIMTIVNQINEVFNDNPRQLVTECLTAVVLESIVQQSMLLDTFVILHAALIAAIYRLQGVEVGAYFIQALVEKYGEYYKNSSSKEASNLISLLTACYSFQVVSCKLLYNLIENLITEISEINTELLLRIVKNAGQQLRTDDPNSLKEIILSLNKKVANQELNTRTKFLIETITNLKNNRNKSSNSNEMVTQLITRMKKVLGTINHNKFHEPLQVTLDDIQSVETKGKWWLVGSAWKGNLTDSKLEDIEVNKEQLNDILDSAEPNWMELARSQRMNTDIRRAIFISIMSSSDYIDAFTKLDKLRLKRSQEREIPKILLHCVSIEKSYNPYYGLLANKLSSSHNLRKTLQFSFWDFMKDLEGEEEEYDSEDNQGSNDYFKNITKDLLTGTDDDAQLQRIVNLGKFFGNLIGESSLPLHSLKHVNFLSLNSDASLFIEVLLISFLNNIGKKSELAGFGQGLSKSAKAQDLKFQDKLLIDILVKCKTQTQLLRGLQYFLQEKVRNSDIIAGKKQRRRVEWGVDCACDVCDEFLKSAE
jgi:nucleolar MIF4G domain-containing protein 1